MDWIKQNGATKDGSTLRGISGAAQSKYGREGFASTPTRLNHDNSRSVEYIKESLGRTRAISADIELPEDEAARDSLQRKIAAYTTENFLEAMVEITPYLGNTEREIHRILDTGNNILAEGAQGYGLDIDHGLRGQVTSSHTGAGGALIGLGLGPGHVRKVYGVAKLVKSRVGGDLDSMPTYVGDEEIETLLRGQPGMPDYEAGKSTKRLRSMGWFDMPEVKRAIRDNGIDELFVTKLDTIGKTDTTKVATHYIDDSGAIHDVRPNCIEELRNMKPEYSVPLSTWDEDISDTKHFADLPAAARNYLQALEDHLQVPISLVGVGYRHDQYIDRRH